MSLNPAVVPALPPEASRDHVAAAMAERYVEVQYAFVQFLSEHLVDCARAFDGDLEQVLILAVLGQAHLTAFMAQPERRQGRLSYGMSALRLADVTALPRETVRRKLAKLAERGWIEHVSGGWRLAAQDGGEVKAARDLAEPDRRGIERLARLHAEISRILAAPARIPLAGTRD